MILSRLNHIKQISKTSDLEALFSVIRSGLHRNLGGSNNPKLFSQCFTGSKTLIEDYQAQVVKSLNLIYSGNFGSHTLKEKLEYFTDTIQSFGRTALILEGGISLGGVHLGVIKALYEHQLLPDIICGSSMGSLIAAYVCVHSNDMVNTIQQEGENLKLKLFLNI